MQEADFDAFVRENRVALVRFAAALTAGDAHLAEDLVQGALVRVYLTRPSRPGDLRAYVRRCIVNGLIDHKRRPFSRRERPSSELPDQAAAPTTDSVDPELVAALRRLPVRMRAAVVLRHIEGLSVEETAAALSCSNGNVKSQTARGLDRLRELLAHGGVTAAPDNTRAARRVGTTTQGEPSCPTS